MKWNLLPTLTLTIALFGLIPEPVKAQSVSRVIPTIEFQPLQPTQTHSPTRRSPTNQTISRPTPQQTTAIPTAIAQPDLTPPPVLQDVPPVPSEFITESIPFTSESNPSPRQTSRTIDASATIIIAFPARHLGMMDDGKHQMTVPLMQPLRDKEGVVVVPEFSPVQVELSPHRDSMRLRATAIDVNGRMVRIKSSTAELGAIRAIQATQHQQASDNRLQLTDVGSGLGAIAGGGEPKGIIVGSLVGTALSWLFNDNSADHIYEVMIPEGETHMLELLEPITVPVSDF